MSFEYVDADNTRFLIFIAASRTNHQIQLAISRCEALLEGFPTHVFVLNSVTDRERSNKNKFAFSSLLHSCVLSLSLSLSLVIFEYKFLFNEVDDFIYLSIFFFIERDALISNPRF